MKKAKPPPRTKSGMNSVMKGNTGEFYALAELSRRGWTAAQTARNTRVYDILALKGAHQVAIRVKTKTSDARVFQWNAKEDGQIFIDIAKNDFCLLVDIPARHEEFPQFYIVPTTVLHDWLTGDFSSWVSTPGPIKAQRNPENKRRLFYMDEETDKTAHGYAVKLKPYRGNWDILEGKKKGRN
jgi:hypothetical protein